MEPVSTSATWRVGSGALHYRAEFQVDDAEVGGIYLVNLRPGEILPLVEGLEHDDSHWGRGPAPVSAGTGQVDVESPALLPGATLTGLGQRTTAVSDGLLVLCWDRGIREMTFDARGPAETTQPSTAAARSWTVRDLEGGPRARAGPVNVARDGYLEVDAPEATLLAVVLVVSDQSSAAVTVSSPREHRTIEVSPRVGDPTLIRHVIWAYSADPLRVDVSIAGDNTETKLFVTACDVPRMQGGEIWRTSSLPVDV